MMTRLLAALALLTALPAHSARADEGPPAGGGKHAQLLGPAQFPQSDGEGLYHAVCQACHMENGQGGAGAAAFPALAKNPKLELAAYPLTMVTHGNRAMPGFKTMMSDAQIAAVVGYVRTHFGNFYGEPVTADEARQVREAGK